LSDFVKESSSDLRLLRMATVSTTSFISACFILLCDCSVISSLSVAVRRAAAISALACAMISAFSISVSCEFCSLASLTAAMD
jgi:hypothetical protein